MLTWLAAPTSTRVTNSRLVIDSSISGSVTRPRAAHTSSVRSSRVMPVSFGGRLGNHQSLARRFALRGSYQTELLAAFLDVDVVTAGRILTPNISLGLQG